MTTLEDARTAIHTQLQSLRPKRRALVHHIGSTLAEPLVTRSAFPRDDLAAMDGYAVSGNAPWKIRPGIRYAGAASTGQLSAGEAVRIATGAAVPAGAEAVIRDEHLALQGEGGEHMLDLRPESPSRNDIRRQGENWQVGDTLLAAGARVSTAVVSAAASAEVQAVAVRGPVRAHVAVSGDELRTYGPLAPGQTRDAVGPVLPALLRGHDIICECQTYLRDRDSDFRSLFAAGSAVDLVIVVGATGRGAADHLRLVLQHAGADVLVDGIDIRPGGSLIVSQLPAGPVVLGLPGNPFAAIAALLAVGPDIVDALTKRNPATKTYGLVSNASAISTATTRLLPARRRANGGGWEAASQVKTAHLGAMLGHDGIVVVRPGLTEHEPAEILEMAT